jgi:uncharacterized protein
MAEMPLAKQTTTGHPVDKKLAHLERLIDAMGSVLVAYSGGVDSAYLLKVAVERLGPKVLAVTADSPSIPREELEAATELAERIGAWHAVIATDEMNDADYVANAPDRCYHCKKTLFSLLTEYAREQGYEHIVEGTNLTDLSDYRPGSRAVAEFAVLSPLKEAGLTKDEIRELSRKAGLPTWDKPAAPCLSSRIPYGSPVTIEKLSRIEQAEGFIRSLGFTEFRVRDHGDIARIEVPRTDMPRLIESDPADAISARLKRLGYRYVAVDLIGFRSGSLNEVLELKDDE